jgi:tetratricopeptide (TPR) repeat protein
MAIWSGEIKEVEKLHDSIKGQFPDLDNELEQLIKTDDANVVMLYSRRCLEVIITDLCENELKRPRKTEPLKGIIDKLNKEERVPSHIITSMDHLNSLANYGTHPKDFDPEQIKPVLNNLSTVLKWYLKYKENLTIGKIKAEEETTHIREPLEKTKKEDGWEDQVKPAKFPRQKLLSGIFITAILIIVIALYAYPKLFKRNPLDDLRSSGERITVAVLPFQNMTNDTTLNVWQNGIQENLITYLSNFIDELGVRQPESVNTLIKSKGLTNYASITPSVGRLISQKLDADVFICGSIQHEGAILRVNAKLIDSETKEILKSFEIDGTYKEETIFYITDSIRKKVTDFLIISRLVKKVPGDIRSFATTNSPEAYRYFIYGNNSFLSDDYSSAVKWYLQAVKSDSNFVFAAYMLATAYGHQDLIYQAKQWSRWIYNRKDRVPLPQKLLISSLYATFFETPVEDIGYLKQLIEIDNQQPIFHSLLGGAYYRLFQYDKAVPEFEKVLEIYKKWRTKPMMISYYYDLGMAYHMVGDYEKEKLTYKKAVRDFPNEPLLNWRRAVNSLSAGDTVSANRFISKYITFRKEKNATEVTLAYIKAQIYFDADILDMAEKYYRQSLSFEPENVGRLGTLAFFLIDKDRNISEGLALIEKALKTVPGSYWLLDTKGWGLYKEGKYEEALEILKKSWDIRRQIEGYDHGAFLHLEAAKKAVANQK